MLLCEDHKSPVGVPCHVCQDIARREDIARQLAIFLGVNEVRNYVSPGGYRLKIITHVHREEDTKTSWHQSRKEDA